MYRWLIIAVSLVLLSCASQKELGVTPLADGTKISEEYHCDRKKLPFIIIEQNGFPSTSVQAGKDIQHRFVYAACTSNQQPIYGSLKRKISEAKGGSTIVPQVTPNFEIKPGRWVVNDIVRVPPTAKPGNYNFNLIISSQTTMAENNFQFTVVKK